MSDKYTLKFRAVNRGTFLNIKTGKKSIETRAASERYKDIKTGDTVVLVCGKDKFQKKVKKVKIFKSIRSMLKTHPIQKIEPRVKTEKELRDIYYSFSNYKEKIKKYGLIAIELK